MVATNFLRELLPGAAPSHNKAKGKSNCAACNQQVCRTLRCHFRQALYLTPELLTLFLDEVRGPSNMAGSLLGESGNGAGPLTGPFFNNGCCFGKGGGQGIAFVCEL
jgi:hypothetical protein